MNPVPASIKAATRAQVNLLPPEVNEKRARARMRSLVLLGFALFVAVIAVAYAGVAFLSAGAVTELEEAQAETERINTEIATYSEVDQVKATLLNSQSAQYTAASVEVFWPYLVGTLTSVMPAPMTIKSVTVVMPGVNSSPGLPTSAFDVAGVGEVVIQVHSPTWVDTATVEKALADNPIFSRARVTSSQFNEGEDEEPPFYEMDVSITLSYDILMLRYTDYWTGDAEGGTSLRDFYQSYLNQMADGLIPSTTMPPLPEVERPVPQPGVVPGAQEPAPAPSPSTSPSPESEAS